MRACKQMASATHLDNLPVDPPTKPSVSCYCTTITAMHRQTRLAIDFFLFAMLAFQFTIHGFLYDQVLFAVASEDNR